MTTATLTEDLKVGSRQQHAVAESQTFQRQLFQGTLPVAAYRQFLEQSLLIHRQLELMLQDVHACQPATAAFLGERQRHSVRLEADIRAIQPDADLTTIVPLASTRAFLRHLERLNGAHAWALLGVWYVLEGSKNGGRHLAKAVARSFSGATGSPTQYLDPYGDDQQALWQAFKGGMDALPLDAGSRVMLQRVSAMTFDAVTNICREIMGEEPLAGSSGAAACPHMSGSRG